MDIKTNRSKNALDALVSGVAASPIQFDNISVSFKSTIIVSEFANCLSNLVIWNLNLTDEQQAVARRMDEYVTTLIAYRCNYVTKSSFPSDYRGKFRWVIPSVIDVLLKNIGYVEDQSIGVSITPAPCDDSMFMDIGVFNQIEGMLLSLVNHGFEYSPEMTRNPEGSWDLMCLSVVNDHIVSSTMDSHPTYALMASFLGFNAVNTFLQPRVSYGPISMYRNMIQSLVSLKVNSHG